MQILNNNKIRISIFIIIFLTCGLLYLDSFSAYFFQDDWFSFSISQATNISEFLKFFSPRTDVIYYRPVGMQIPFFLIQTFFGLEPLVFRVMTFLFHCLNILLVFGILTQLVKNKFSALTGATAYALSAVHFTTFYWAATLAFVLGPTWYLSAILAFLKNKQIGFILFLILGFMTNELLVTLPATLFLIQFLLKKKIKLQFIILSGITSFLYITFRFIFRPAFDGDYALGFELISFIKTLRDYILWSFNFPEEVTNQFISFFTFNQEFAKSFVNSIRWWSTNITLMSIFAVLSIYVAFRKKESYTLRYMILSFLWFVITLSPLLIFREHAYSYYLPIPFIGILIFFASSVNLWLDKFPKQKNQVALFTLGLLFIFINSSRHTVIFNKDVHWAPRRAVIARKLVHRIKNEYPVLPKNAVVIVEGSDEYKWALGDQHALQVLYKSDLISTFYQKEKEQSIMIDNIRPTIIIQ